MNESNEVRVEIDDRIRQHPDLFPAVGAASDYFVENVRGRPGVVVKKGLLRWELTDYPSGKVRVIRRYSEPNGAPDGHTLTKELDPPSLFDPVQRDVSMLALLQDILRWRELDERTRQHLR